MAAIGGISTGRLLASWGELRLALPECQRGLGAVIGSTASRELIHDVRAAARRDLLQIGEAVNELPLPLCVPFA
jgi:hypothetical protein